MGSSLLTNTSAMTALQTLNKVNNNLTKTQNRVATGLRINEAADNTAYFAISTQMKSDAGALGVIKDTLGLGKARVDQAYSGVAQVKEELQKIKELIVSAGNLSLEDQKKIKTSITASLSNIKTAVESASMAGTNMLVQEGGTGTIDIAASFRRKGTSINIDTIKINKSDIQLAGVKKNGSANFSTGLLAAVFKKGFFAFKEEVALTVKQLQNYSDTVDAVLSKVFKADSVLGAAKTQIDSQHQFVGTLVDNLDKSVGILVDADMNAESARLSALQVQQQLAVQALSIANQSSQSLLSLFR